MKLCAVIFLVALFFNASHPSLAVPPNLRGRDSAENSNGNGKGHGNGNSNGSGGDGDTPSKPLPEVGEATSPPPPNGDDNPAADTEAVAELLDLSLQDAELLLQQQKEFSELVATLQGENHFMQAEMPSKPNGVFRLKFKNGKFPPHHQAAIEKFKGKNKNAKVETVATRLSLKDAEARGKRLAVKLEKKNYLQVVYSIDGDGLELAAKKPAKDKGKDKGKIPPGRAAEILELEGNDVDLTDMTLILQEHDDEDLYTLEHTYGGRKISGGGYQCTTGFSVISGSGTGGISTAAHCTGMDWYDAVPPESNYATRFMGQHCGSWGDVEWHTSAHIEPAEYYATPTTRWPVRSIAMSVSKGEVVCFYSRMQGKRTCDRVFKTSVSSGCASRLVAMRSDNTVGGDSGGPWSYYDKAYGIHRGDQTICDPFWPFNCNRRNVWSRVSYLGPALGVVVRTK